MPTFGNLMRNYPRESRPDLFNVVLGGGWPALVDDLDNYGNTCAIRLSVALNRSGLPVPVDLGRLDGNHVDKNRNSIIIKVRTAEALLTRLFGQYYWGMSKQPGTPLDFRKFPAKTGVVLYHANFETATGHVDLWNKTGCVGGCPAADVSVAFDVALWRVE